MNTIHTLIVTTDFSATAVNAAEYGAAFARYLGVDTLVLYHSYSPVPVATEIPIPGPGNGSASESSLFALAELAARIRPFAGDAIRIETVADEKPVLQGVEDLASVHQAGLIVAGTTGKSGLQKFMLGSNTMLLVTEATLPLLVVPDSAAFGPVTKIIFACELADITQRTPVSMIRFLREQLSASLLVLNVAEEGKRLKPDIIPEQYKLHGLLDDLSPEYHYITDEDIAEGIIKFADEEEAGLVVTVPKSRSFLGKLFGRSVTKELAQRTEVPLLILREKSSI